MVWHEIDSGRWSIIASSDGSHLTGLWFRGQKYFAEDHLPAAAHDMDVILEKTALWLDSYLAGQKPERIQTAPDGSEFRRQVWTLLSEIPYGQWTTYGTIARVLRSQTGKAVSAQAVGGAVGHNPISLMIPCHRVIGADGSLTGYAGGLAIKEQLLRLEGILTDNGIDQSRYFDFPEHR